MEIKSLSCLTPESLDTLLLSLPFYKQVRQESHAQYDLLLSYSRLFSYEPGETILEEGRVDHWLYFLLRGQLAVFSGGTNDQQHIVNYITPGEVFGDLALMLKKPRSASIVADANCRKILVFGTDFDVFGELSDFSRISLLSKLIYYRNMVHNLRWKLEVYRITYPEQLFAAHHRKVKLYIGSKNTTDELISLDGQARSLAGLLLKWNEAFRQKSIPNRDLIGAEILSRIP